jgi:hypothetical protein
VSPYAGFPGSSYSFASLALLHEKHMMNKSVAINKRFIIASDLF